MNATESHTSDTTRKGTTTMKRTMFTLLALMSLPAAVHAYTGTIAGRLVFYDTRTMAADPGQGPYTTAMRNTWRGVRGGKVYVVQEGTGQVIGSGATNGAGYYVIGWSSPTFDPRVRVTFKYESSQAYGGATRFRMTTPSGGLYTTSTAILQMRTGQTVNIGTGRLGTSTAPDKLATMMETATEFTGVALTAGKLWTNLVNVDVKFPVPTATTGLTTDRHHIEMADNWVVFNNSTLAHELGHIAHLIAFDYDWLGSDCSLNGDGHSWNSVEWESCAFSEGFADFVAAATFFYPGAASPRSYDHDIEIGCSGARHQSESNVARYFWDMYDSRNESGDAVTLPFSWIFAKLDVFPFATGTRHTWENFFNRNGTNSWDFYWHAAYSGGATNVNLGDLLLHNCVNTSSW